MTKIENVQNCAVNPVQHKSRRKRTTINDIAVAIAQLTELFDHARNRAKKDTDMGYGFQTLAKGHKTGKENGLIMATFISTMILVVLLYVASELLHSYFVRILRP